MAKITKNGLQPDWTIKTFTRRTSFAGRGAIFTPEWEKLDISKLLAAYGLEDVEIVEEPGLDCLFVDTAGHVQDQEGYHGVAYVSPFAPITDNIKENLQRGPDGKVEVELL